MKRLVSLIAVLGVCLSAACADATVTKAARAYSLGEWANASALYGMLTRRYPTDTEYFARAIVSSTASGDSTLMLPYTTDALHNGAAIDSLFAGVRKAAFEAGQADIYPGYLEEVRRGMPWMARAADSRLLQWYTDRDDGPMIIRYAEKMLAGLPDDPRFMLALAHGYILTGQPDLAMDTWQRIIARDPDNFDALVNAANLAQIRGDEATARALFTRAYEVHPTPYIAAKLGM